jgi:phosphate/sulfate permease
MQYFSIAQVNQPNQTNTISPVTYMVPIVSIVLAASLAFYFQKKIAKLNSTLTEDRENTKKINGQLEELQNMKGEQKIIDAISQSEAKLLNVIGQSEAKLLNVIGQSEAKLLNVIGQSEAKLLGSVNEVKTDVGKLQESVTEVKQNQGLLVMELKTRGLITETSILK